MINNIKKANEPTTSHPTALDPGCGLGKLSQFFSNLGFAVTAVDFAESSIDIVKQNSPKIKTLVHDITQKLPFENNSFDVAIANLSLHYFSANDTKNIIAEIKRILKPNGILVGSVVSTDEFEKVKARGVKFIQQEPNFYHELTDNGKKQIRFFNHHDINTFFADFDFIYLNNKFEQRMGKPKAAWEFIARPK